MAGDTDLTDVVPVTGHIDLAHVLPVAGDTDLAHVVLVAGDTDLTHVIPWQLTLILHTSSPRLGTLTLH